MVLFALVPCEPQEKIENILVLIPLRTSFAPKDFGLIPVVSNIFLFSTYMLYVSVHLPKFHVFERNPFTYLDFEQHNFMVPFPPHPRPESFTVHSTHPLKPRTLNQSFPPLNLGFFRLSVAFQAVLSCLSHIENPLPQIAAPPFSR